MEENSVNDHISLVCASGCYLRFGKDELSISSTNLDTLLSFAANYLFYEESNEMCLEWKHLLIWALQLQLRVISPFLIKSSI